MDEVDTVTDGGMIVLKNENSSLETGNVNDNAVSFVNKIHLEC